MSKQSDTRRGRTPADARQELHGTCKGCGLELIVVRTTGKGFTSHHEAPLCDAYRKLLEQHPPAAEAVTVVVGGGK